MEEDLIIELTEEKMKKVIENLDKRYTTVRAGRANPAVLDGIYVSYYGSDTPLKQLATISIPEARILAIKPFDKSSLHQIEKAIFEANIGLTPSNDGEIIRIIIPQLTEDRRIELTKQVKQMTEEAKIAIRNIRREAMEDIEKLKLAEDVEKGKSNEVQELVNDYNKKVDELLKAKEEELMMV